MYDTAIQDPTRCACGKHYCRDCANNTDGNPEHCTEWDCFACAVCRFKPIGDDPDTTAYRQ